MRALALTVALVLALFGAGQAAAQDASRAPTRQGARERWEAMTPEEQSLMRKRFEAFKGMQDGHRRELEQRHGRWQESERRTLERLPKSARTRLEELSPQKRREVLHELTAEELSARGRELLQRLPPEWRERIEAAEPEQRRRVLEEFRRQNRDRGMRGVLDRAQREQGLGAAERGEIEALPEAERAPRLVELHARALRARIQRDGLPPWLEEAEWQRLASLEPHAFLEELHARRRLAGGRARSQAGGAGAAGENQGERAEASLSRQLRALARPDPTWRVELSKLTPGERRLAIEARVRTRVEDFLQQHPDVVTPEQRAALAGAQDREFLKQLRKVIGSPRFPGAPGRAGPSGPGGTAPRRPPPGPRGDHDAGRRGQPGARGSREPSRAPPRSQRP